MRQALAPRGTGALLFAKFHQGRHAIASVRGESKLKVGVVSVSAIVLWFGAFLAFVEGFKFLRNFDLVSGREVLSIGDILMYRLLSVFSLALFLLLIFSNVLVAFSTLYRAREMRFLLQLPLTFRQIFLTRFVECVVFSSWASAYLGSPLLLAYGLSTDAPWPFYIAAGAFYVPFVCLPAALGAMLTMGVVRVYPHVPRWTLPVTALAVLVGFSVYLYRAFNIARLSEDPVFQTTGLSALTAITAGTQSPWLPSYWTAHGLIAAADGQFRESAFQFLLLVSNALLGIWLAAEMAQRLLFPGWNGLAGGRSRGFGRFRPLEYTEGLLRFLPEPLRALSVKDVKLFWREPTQWLQFIVFFGIMAVYVATVRNYEMPGFPHYGDWIAGMNIAASALILATLTSRFVYPLVSLEGRRFWIIGLAPITLRQIVWQKYWLSVATTSVFTIALVTLSCLRLGVGPVPFALAVYSIIVTNFGLSGLATGLGSLYPNFQEDNPARIVSGMGGTLNFLLSMGYIALVIAAEMVILQWESFGDRLSTSAYWWSLAVVVGFVTVLSAACALAPMRLGLRNLSRMEF